MELILFALSVWGSSFAAACLIVFWQRLYRQRLYFALSMHVLGVAVGAWAIVELIIK